MPAARSDIESLIRLSMSGRADEWAGDSHVAGAVAVLMRDDVVASLYRQGGSVADFLLAATASWIASELCTTIPDPGRILTSPLEIPTGVIAQAIERHSRSVHADESATVHARSLAGMVLSHFERGASFKVASHWVAPFRELLHASCTDSPMSPMPRRLNRVAAWSYRVFHRDRACRHKILRQAIDANNAARGGKAHDSRYSGLAIVGWEFGYRDAWVNRDTAKATARIVAAAVSEGERELFRRATWQAIQLPWRGKRPRPIAADAVSRTVSASLGRAGVAKMVLPRYWGEVLQFNNPGLLVGLGKSMAGSNTPESALIGSTLDRLAGTELNSRPLWIERESRSAVHQGRYLDQLWKSMPGVLILAATLGVLSVWFLPVSAAVLLAALATSFVITRARRRALFSGTVGWPQALLLGAIFSGLAITPQLCALWFTGASWTLLSGVLFVASMVFSVAVETLVVASPFVTYKLGSADWLFPNGEVPEEVTSAFDEELARMFGAGKG